MFHHYVGSRLVTRASLKCSSCWIKFFQGMCLLLWGQKGQFISVCHLIIFLLGWYDKVMYWGVTCGVYYRLELPKGWYLSIFMLGLPLCCKSMGFNQGLWNRGFPLIEPIFGNIVVMEIVFWVVSVLSSYIDVHLSAIQGIWGMAL